MKKLVLEVQNESKCTWNKAYLQRGISEKVESCIKYCAAYDGKKTFNEYTMYDLPKEVAEEMNTDEFKVFLKENGVELFTSDNKSCTRLIERFLRGRSIEQK